MRKFYATSWEYILSKTFTVFSLILLIALSVNLSDGQTIDLSKPVGSTKMERGANGVGGVSYSIPISVLPGINGLQPNISLNYSSQARDGIAGWGWNIGGYSTITRAGKSNYYNGIAKPISYTNTDDAFVLDGQRLFATSGNNGANGTVYGLENESYNKIESFGGTETSGPDWFKVTTKDGRVLEFGHAQDTKLLSDNGASTMVWLLNKITDRNGNYIIFKYWIAQTDRNFALTDIDYTGNTASGILPGNKIQLVYTVKDNWKNSRMFQSGMSIAYPYRLDKINVINSSGTTVKSYQTGYSVLRNQNFLTSFTERGADGTSLNPLRFVYGSNITATDVAISDNYGAYNYNNVYTGDVDGDGKDDIVAAYYHLDNNNIPHYSSYWVLGDYITTPMGPAVSPVYSYKYSDSANNTVAQQIKSPGGYYNFLTSDYDGDTKKDVLMSNWKISGAYMMFNGISINYSRYYNSISGTVYEKKDYTNIPHSIQYTNDFKYSYYSGSNTGTNFIPGDFDGDGAMDYILILGINPSNSFKAFFSSPSKGIVNEEIINFGVEGTSTDPFYATSVASAKDVVPLDFDGDGKTEILIQKSTQSYILSVFPVSPSTGYTYAATKLYTTSSIKAGYRVFPGDFNGDGATDLLVRASQTDPYASWNLLYSTGKAFKSYPFIWTNRPYLENDAGTSNAHLVVVGDINGDGRSDIWHSLDNAAGGLHSDHVAYYSNGIPLDGQNSTTAFTFEKYSRPQTVNKSVSTQTIVGDINGDAKPDVMSLLGSRSYFIYPRPFKEDHLMASAIDGYGNTSKFDYELMSNTGSYERSYYYYYDVFGAPIGQSQNGSPYNVLNVPMYLLTHITTPNGIGGTAMTSYTYKDAAYSPMRGFLGFKQVSETDATGITNYTHSEITPSVLLPHTVRQFSTYGVDTISDVRITDTLRRLSANYFDKRYVHETSKTLSINNLTGAAIESANTYDSYGNVTTNTTKKGYLSGSAITPVETAVTTTTFGTHGTPVPALPESVVAKNTRTGQTQVSKTNTYTYDTKGNVLTSTEFSGTALATKTTNTYDNFGNIKTVAMTAPNTLTPTVANTYDNTGKFLTKRQTTGSGITKTESFTYDPIWGKLATSLSSDGLTTSYFYDNGYGRLIKKAYPDGNIMTYTLAWESGLNQRYSIASQRQADGGMYAKDYYDILERRIKSEIGGFNGQILSNVINYNFIGQVISQTDLHYPTETARTTNNTFDNYGRPTGSSDGVSSVTMSYTKLSGGQYKTTSTNGAGQTTSKVQDGSGRVIQAIDNGGQLNFTYDSWGNRKIVTLGGTTVVSNVFDIYGRKSSTTDKNAGTIKYEYNALGKITKQTDALNHVYTVVYDAFGRMTSHTGAEGTVSYVYYKDASGIKVNDNISKITGFAGDVTNYTYDNLGREISESLVFDGQTLTKTKSYDSYGNLTKTTYPSGVVINDTYDKNSDLIKTTLGSGTAPTALFTATAMNCKGIYTGYSYGNGKASIVTYDLTKNAPSRLYTSGIQDLQFNFEGQTGNLISRKDAIKNLTETFTYDNLNRLTGSKVNNVQQFSITFDNISGTSLGNIKSKSDVGNYVYDNSKINAVKYITSTTGGQTPPALISHNEQDISYTPFLKAASLLENGYELTYTYGYDQQRIKSVLKQGSNVLESRYYLGAFERQIKGSVVRDIHYIKAGNGLCAIVVKQGNSITPYYVYTDHLGSILTLTDTTGKILATQNFDAWGRNRNPSNWSYTGVPASPEWLYRGFTGHEHLKEFAVINMNGRIYDPLLGRMLSPDNYVQIPWSTQGYNRYEYAANNPLLYNDPSGEFFGIDDLIAGAVGAIINLGSQIISGNVHGLGQALGYLGTGFASGVAFEYGGPMASGIIAGAGNAWVAGGTATQIVTGAIIGGIAGRVGQVAGEFAGGLLAKTTGIVGGAIGTGIQGAAGGTAAGFTAGTLSGVFRGEGLGQIGADGVNSALMGAAFGAATGAISGGITASKSGQNIWTGRALLPKNNSTVTVGELEGNFMNGAMDARTVNELLEWLQKNGGFEQLRKGGLQAELDPNATDLNILYKNITESGNYPDDVTVTPTSFGSKIDFGGEYGDKVYIKSPYNSSVGGQPSISIDIKSYLGETRLYFKIRYGAAIR